MSKKALIAILVIIAIASGAYFLRSILSDSPDVDAQKLVREAVLNSLNIESANFDAEIKAEFSETENSSGTINLELIGKIANATAFIPEVDYQITVDADLDLAGQKISTGGTVGLKILEKTVYAQFSDITLPELPEEQIAPVKFFIEMFKDKWFSVPLGTLAESNPEIAEALAQQEIAQEKMKATMQKIFTEKDVYLAQNLTLDGDIYQVAVVPNFDVILSQEFLKDLFDVLAASPNMQVYDLEIPSEEELLSMKGEIQNIYSQINPQLILKISKSDKQIVGQQISANIDLATLELPDKPEDVTGKISINIGSTISGINETQTITAPADFVDFGSMMGFGGMGGLQARGDNLNLEDSGKPMSTDPGQFCESDSDCIAITHPNQVGDNSTGCSNKTYTEKIITNNPGYFINETIDCVCWQYGTEKICEPKEWH